MKFGIIFEIEANPITDDDRFSDEQADLWEQTEDGESECHEGWQHEKWTALLEEEDFFNFLNHVDITFQGKGHALGSPMPDGGNFGFTPALVFSYENEECELSAYVTPYPMPGEAISGVDTFKRLPLFGNRPFTEKDWKKIERRVLELTA